MNELEEAELLVRKKHGCLKPNLLYVRITAGGKVPLIGKETCLCEGKKSISYYLNNSYLIYSQTNKEGEWCSAYSKYHDVFLSETEYGELKQEIRELDSLIEELSSYMCSSGKYYADYTQSP